jgi:hypothetical protein
MPPAASSEEESGTYDKEISVYFRQTKGLLPFMLGIPRAYYCVPYATPGFITIYFTQTQGYYCVL